MTEYIAQAVGFAGIAANLIIYQQKTRTGLLRWKLTSDVLWALHYLLMEGYSGAAISFIAMLRELFFMKQQSKEKKDRRVYVFFLCLTVLSAVITWKGPFSLLPMTASIISVSGFWKGDPRLSRILSFPVSACMLSYDLVVHSFAGLISELLTITSSVIGVCRHDLKHYKNGSTR